MSVAGAQNVQVRHISLGVCDKGAEHLARVEFSGSSNVRIESPMYDGPVEIINHYCNLFPAPEQ